MSTENTHVGRADRLLIGGEREHNAPHVNHAGYNCSVRLTLSWEQGVIESARSCVVAVSRFSGFLFSLPTNHKCVEISYIYPKFFLVGVEKNRLCSNFCIIPLISRCQKLILTTRN